MYSNNSIWALNLLRKYFRKTHQTIFLFCILNSIDRKICFVCRMITGSFAEHPNNFWNEKLKQNTKKNFHLDSVF